MLSYIHCSCSHQNHEHNQALWINNIVLCHWEDDVYGHSVSHCWVCLPFILQLLVQKWRKTLPYIHPIKWMDERVVLPLSYQQIPCGQEIKLLLSLVYSSFHLQRDFRQMVTYQFRSKWEWFLLPYIYNIIKTNLIINRFKFSWISPIVLVSHVNIKFAKSTDWIWKLVICLWKAI